MKQLFLTAILLLLTPFVSCTGDSVENVYCSYSAFFNYNRVLTAHPLYVALTGQGQYCSVYQGGQQLYFQSPSETYNDPLTARDMSYKNVIWICGLIIGKSNIPDMTTGNFPLLCFDSACPNCYKNSSISKRLTINDLGVANCSKCHHTYDLNNGGLASEGIKLFRYRFTYDGSNNLLVNNKK